MLKRNFEIRQLGDLRTLEIYLYGEIQGDYYDWWNDKIIESSTSANYVRKAIDEAGTVDKINVYINSCGGSVSEGIAIYNILKRSPAVKTVYVDAFAYSIASVIAMAGNKVVMPSNTTMMIHNAMMGAYGNSSELRKAADNLDTINQASCNSYLVKAQDKLTEEILKPLLDAETFLTAEQACGYGLCDEVIDPVDISRSVEIVEQAQRSRNPVAKKAAEHIKLQAKQSHPTPKPSEPTQDKYEFALDVLKKIPFFN